MAVKSLDLRERKFGTMTVVRSDTEVWVEPVIWLCFCKCGQTVSASEAELIKGEVTSCGKCTT